VAVLGKTAKKYLEQCIIDERAKNMKLVVLLLSIFLGVSRGISQEAVPYPGSMEGRPNIVLIVSDDHAKNAVGAYGSTLIPTPQIDRIAREGVIFTNAFVTNAICAPSRAVILTGKYSHLNGLRDNRDRFDGDQQTFPKLLQAAGYQTMLIGKWHLRSVPQGFDYWNVLPGQGAYYNPRFIAMGDTTRKMGYVTDIITDLALEALTGRDTEKPFCLLYHHKAPHRNWMPNVPHLQFFNDRDFVLPETFFDDYRTRSRAAKEQEMEIARHLFSGFDLKLPLEYVRQSGADDDIVPAWDAIGAWESTLGSLTEEQQDAWSEAYEAENKVFLEDPPQGKDLAAWKYRRYIKDYLRCVVSMDENIGRLLDYLDAEGLAENTIVIYTSDQGFFLGEHGWFDKRFMYEESLGTPLIVRYPAAFGGGTMSDAMVLNLDLAPTILEFAGVQMPDDLQGESLRPLLQGKPADGWRSSIYYHYYEYPHGWHSVKKQYGLRTRRYKLIHYYDDIDEWELFDLQIDPHELQNEYDTPAYSSTIRQLKLELQNLRVQFGDTEE
jgi:arylsulfatase A-like enzyme